MKILDRLFPAREVRMVSSITGNPAEDGWRPIGHTTLGGAEGLATVIACVNVISSSVASLPVYVYRVSPTGRTEEPTHPLARLVKHGPNARQPWPDFIGWLVAEVLLNGNAVAEIVLDSQGRITELRPVPWRSISVGQLPSGRLRYDFNEPSIGGAAGPARRLLEGEVLHLRDYAPDSILGVSRLRRAAGVAEGALLVDGYAKSLWRNMGLPSVVLKHEKNLSAAAAARLKENWMSRFGGHNRGAPAVLEEGLDVKVLEQVSPEDAEILAARRFGVEELARIFDVPPVMVGDLSHGTFTNSAVMLRYFAQSCLASWCRKLEAAFAHAVLTEAERESFEIDFDMSGLLRADPEVRWESHKIAIETGVLTTDEVREIEGFNPRGDREPVVE
jgi:HK97 family phage portal protein